MSRPDDSGTVSWREGVHGGKLIFDRLDQMMRERSVTGWVAQVRYLTGSVSGRGGLAEAGVPRERLVAWLIGPEGPGGAAPSPVNRVVIERVYVDVRRHNLVPRLVRELNNGGRGTVVEVTPADDVDAQSGGQMPVEELTIDDWEEYVQAWADDDLDAMFDLWEDDADDLYGGDGAYYFVASIGF